VLGAAVIPRTGQKEAPKKRSEKAQRGVDPLAKYREQAQPQAVDIQILGMFDAGTHLLRAMVERNFADLKVADDCDGGGIWKHVPPQELRSTQVKRYLNQGNALISRRASIKVIAVVRSPLAQFASWQKAGYNLAHCVGKDGVHPEGGSRWLVEQCTIGPVDYPLAKGKCAKGGCFSHCKTVSEAYAYASTVAVWNEYVQGYGALDMPNVFVVKYEDLVLYPEQSIRKIAEFLGRGPPKKMHVVNEAVKKDGQSGGRKEALEKIENNNHLDSFRYTDIAAVCERLDPDLLARYGYETDCDGHTTGTHLGHVLTNVAVIEEEGGEKSPFFLRYRWVTGRELSGAGAPKERPPIWTRTSREQQCRNVQQCR